MRLNTVRLLVSDMATMAKFYGKELGLQSVGVRPLLATSRLT
jgi:catechol 2,3-dioxygenase-like lactoylglutathione lyase family enzyme